MFPEIVPFAILLIFAPFFVTTVKSAANLKNTKFLLQCNESTNKVSVFV